ALYCDMRACVLGDHGGAAAAWCAVSHVSGPGALYDLHGRALAGSLTTSRLSGAARTARVVMSAVPTVLGPRHTPGWCGACEGCSWSYPDSSRHWRATRHRPPGVAICRPNEPAWRIGCLWT